MTDCASANDYFLSGYLSAMGLFVLGYCVANLRRAWVRRRQRRALDLAELGTEEKPVSVKV